MSVGYGPKSLAELGFAERGRPVTGLALDSRQVKEGYLFAGLPGSRVHGAEFIQYALRMGAGAILTDAEGARIARDVLDGAEVTLIVAEDPRQAFSAAAALWYGAQPATMVGVTGTNGKTSVASFTRQLWQGLGHAAANIGTTGIEGDFSADLAHTTPDPLTLHAALAEMAAQGITHAAMEASSHGLDQRRLDGVRLVAAGFTNFSQDHLDYHETFEAYFAAKAGLFSRVLADQGMAVINLDDPKGADMMAIAHGAGAELLTVGTHKDAMLRLTAQRFDADGQEMRFTWKGVAHQARLNLVGGFQASNVLVAMGLVMATGAQVGDLVPLLPRLATVRGRMQKVARRENGATVFVDYAHTPDALKTALRALRPHVLGRLVVVFGAGGDRDSGKRPLMGAAAAAAADVVFVTDDNPRSEDPALIRAQVRAGCPEATDVPDRAEAILRGVDALEPGDVLLIAGKGHETGQTVGDVVYPFDDAEQASVAVAALEGRLA
ncbi:UDP-N-acetylmuramoylalanyl-D-glutamate--2,6-diaminopimelate ligase [Dinoroseobacter shibae DFL 12 = DSM 16493]|jgi:UDP-N-acetylmuramoyl-L-alanyl-D-glutamate--2,6-diaminopimelate ligase|uniref:UDP-N-acetylmuramoyl-L-alanyl-D-glutamate--2,6-diaminopimelate ligase n=1 Tax=Dinoroseobacter shibae (strain DSM 16493 / NCIMB 14021 / DFL 12) TaxID=398580 RepID=A8LSB2_DINSH|nr:UDP-N-acetylmuramoyl-L-alanyl-D-glutamate--2,6-diaminopimelate ligase [Dinoroseobacter shibae]ABV94205.1 UDP-N-acetylmuramoylalanyl-D-glutamate--2,6-diaminopimelate ligase [Dinoroseobacter shibae DFL 12 = DSM 16493]URF45647.1 UDP-N-acetylmuramoyl-L-alanyl-D-glutamate--2,6-diaminopimelate ligase [Dinoroseobacter shibae]URF49952.1 UDP-N-acetylmuramoyl-L-alanyl-D-glutamate--2,6-diaminopimelate ligase [Dinoroseobacter shibae]